MNTTTVVGDREPRLAANTMALDPNLRRASVEGVLNELRSRFPGILLRLGDQTDELEGIRRAEADPIARSLARRGRPAGGQAKAAGGVTVHRAASGDLC
jgi:hypothetical protein